jgi:hypothetical protein
MAKPLVLSLDGKEIPVTLVKIDREKLYGSVEIEAFDEKGREASLKVLAADGKTLIDKGGTALATISEKGDSLDRSTLIPVDENGDEIDPVESSFLAPNVLKEAEVDDYLAQIVKSVYLLESFEDSELKYLKDHLSADKIYTFPFSYRGGVEHDDAFVIGAGGEAYMVTGKRSKFQFLKLNQATVLDAPEEQDIDSDDLDFDLL